ncbi:MAG: tripartite tricarboxylate transporter TctB family protein [Dehalobacterium sp.]
MVGKKIDLVSGAAFLIAGLVIFIRSRTLSYSSEFGPGPGFLPTWLGVFICLLSLNLIITSIRKKDKEKELEKSAAFSDDAKKISKVVLALAIYLLLMPLLGFLLTTIGFVLFLLKNVEFYSWKFSVIVSGVVSIFFYSVFKFGLNVPLPSGFLGL